MEAPVLGSCGFRNLRVKPGSKCSYIVTGVSPAVELLEEVEDQDDVNSQTSQEYPDVERAQHPVANVTKSFSYQIGSQLVGVWTIGVTIFWVVERWCQELDNICLSSGCVLCWYDFVPGVDC